MIRENSENTFNSYQMQILKLIATHSSISRVELSRLTGLSKMTISNYVSGFIKDRLVEETEISDAFQRRGRRATGLKISSHSPLICGVLIKRGFLQAIMADLSGKIWDSRYLKLPEKLTGSELMDMILQMIRSLTNTSPRRAIACGVACIGPLNSHTGTLLSPSNFYDIKNLKLTQEVEAHTGLKTVLINDAIAGALSEHLYGHGKNLDNFAYLHIMNGIGMGFVINGKVYNHISGQNGEIGHVSINYSGPQCPCGNRGCLETYANKKAMLHKIRMLSPYYPQSPLVGKGEAEFGEFVEAAAKEDPIALNVLDEFLEYVAIALVSTINLLDFSTLIIGYDCNYPTQIVEKILTNKLTYRLISLQHDKLTIIRSQFGGDAPLIGSCGVIASEIFSGRLTDLLL